jgi:septal ring factor EnvC (AmiA/AmiB activator)
MLLFVQQELDQAKRAIAELEEQLGVERSQLKTTNAERNRASHEKNRLASQLERTQAVSRGFFPNLAI